MSEENEYTVNIEFPPGMVKPIPHYLNTRNIALDLAVLLLALPDLDRVVGDIAEQAKLNESYGDALGTMEAIVEARDVISEKAPKLGSVADGLIKSMENDGPDLATLNFLIIQYPTAAGRVIAWYINAFSQKEVRG